MRIGPGDIWDGRRRQPQAISSVGWEKAGKHESLNFFFFFPLTSYWPAAGCKLAEVGPLNVSGAAAIDASSQR